MADKIYGAARERVDVDELKRLRDVGALWLDARRTRPLWFDGRFLKAQDLNREQNYFLTRQADLAVATGTGAIEGLRVAQGAAVTDLVIGHGHGVTLGGERVVVPADLRIDIANIAVAQKLNMALGLSREPAPPLRLRSGLFVVALRALEYTANPTSAYPTHIDAARTVEDSDIVEATAVTLIPFSLGIALQDPLRNRAEVAHRAFVLGSPAGVPASCLPLAIVELERGRVRWIDNEVARREMGWAHSDELGFGLAPRPLRLAHFRQHDALLGDVVEARTRVGSSLRFAASEYFSSMPSAGRVPSACVDVASGTQFYFPGDMPVELSYVPEDELPLLIDESLLLPPIDLTASADVLEATPLLLLVPVPRHQLAAVEKQLTQPLRLLAPKTASLARLKPMQTLELLRAKLPTFVPTPAPAPLLERGWSELVAKASFLWFVRRRQLAYRASFSGEAVTLTATDEHETERNLRAGLRQLALDANFTRLKARGSAAADLAMVRLLASPRMLESELLMRGAVRELEAATKLDEHAVLEVAARYNNPAMGEGLRLLDALVREPDTASDGSPIEGVAARNRLRIETLAQSLRVADVDEVARRLTSKDRVEFGNALRQALDATDNQPERIAHLVLAQNKRRVLS